MSSDTDSARWSILALSIACLTSSMANLVLLLCKNFCISRFNKSRFCDQTFLLFASSLSACSWACLEITMPRCCALGAFWFGVAGVVSLVFFFFFGLRAGRFLFGASLSELSFPESSLPSYLLGEVAESGSDLINLEGSGGGLRLWTVRWRMSWGWSR